LNELRKQVFNLESKIIKSSIRLLRAREEVRDRR